MSTGTVSRDSSDGAKRRPHMSRRASLIVPSTGARVNDRSYTLTPSNFRAMMDGHSDDESTPLLGSSPSEHRSATGRKFWRLCASGWVFAKSKKAKLVIKCSLAYFIGSLATFVIPVSRLLGHYDGKHMVATCATYFHPGRSAGSMHEATMWALLAFMYSTIISLGSMGVSILFAKRDLIELGHAIVLVVFCAGGLGLIAYAKNVMASPTVSVACSLASISIITILTKEGSVQLGNFQMGKIYQVSMIVASAIVISNVIAFTLWPMFATKELRELMVNTTNSFSESLIAISHSFLNASDEVGSQGTKPSTVHSKTVFGPLLKKLSEARYEHFIWGTEKEYYQEKLLVESMQRLSQSIGGLRSAAATQVALLQEAHKKGQPSPVSPVAMESSSEADANDLAQLFTPPNRDLLYEPTRQQSGSWISTPASNRSISGVPHISEEPEDSDPDVIAAPAPSIAIFEEFIYHLGPPMKSLAWTLKLMLDGLPFGPAPDYHTSINPRFHDSLKKAIELFSEKRQEALNTLYRNDAITKSRSIQDAADVEEVAASCGYFSICLLYFAEEMYTFLEILEQLQYLQETKSRSWTWLKFWKRSKGKAALDREETAYPTSYTASPITPMKRQHTVPNVSPDDAIPFSYKVWKALGVLRRDNVRFAIKTGVGAAIYALPSFIPSTRPIYSLWRGEWGLVSYMIIQSMTIGQTNNSGEARVLGTVFGALLALLAWMVFPENPYALSVFGWLVSIPCFWIILNWKQGTFGRFILLTYNISALYAYSLSVADDDDDDDEGGTQPIITDIVLHRFVAVIVGVVWGLVINRLIWPISARMQLRKGLSTLWLRMALMWTRDPLNSLVEGAPKKHYMNIAEDQALEKALLRLNSLAAAAPHEFRLKGPFPLKEYQNIMKANQGIIDAFHGMSVMISKDPKANRREAEILAFTSKERSDLCTRIAHLFYVLGSSVRLGFPLPESLPNTVRARDRLLAKLFDYRKKIRGTEGEADEDFALIYAYVLVTARISEGLDECIRNVGLLYGVLEDEQLEI